MPAEALVESLKGPKPAIPVTSFWEVGNFWEDEKGAWYVEGYGSTFGEDLQGEIIDPAAAEDAKSQLIGLTLLFNHDVDEPIGKIVGARIDDHGIWLRAKVSKTAPIRWEQIKEGTVSKFSVRLLELVREPRTIEGRRVVAVKKMVITEVSLTSLPANRGAKAALAYQGKSMGGGTEMALQETLDALTAAATALMEEVKSGKVEMPPAEGAPPEGEKPPEATPETDKACAPPVKPEEKKGDKPGEGKYYPEPPKEKKDEDGYYPTSPGAMAKIAELAKQLLDAVQAVAQSGKSLETKLEEYGAEVKSLKAQLDEQAKSLGKVPEVEAAVKTLTDRLPQPMSQGLEPEVQKGTPPKTAPINDVFGNCFPDAFSVAVRARDLVASE